MTYGDPIPTVRAALGKPLPHWPAGSRPVGFDWSTGTPSTCEPDQWEQRNWRNVPGPFYGAATDNCWTGRDCAPAHVMYDGEHNQEFVWTPELVREWAVAFDRTWSVSEREEEREAAAGARDYVAYTLGEGRAARPGEGLPGL